MSGLLIGAMLPFVFSAMAMLAVGRAAGAMIEEVRRQFREIPGLLEGTGTADYRRCIDISTTASLREMVLPGLMAVTVPVIVGLLSLYALGGLLVGVTASGVLMALFQSNAGGAWDNAKKYVEAGHHGGKGSEAHKAAVTGDTVGDSYKDTAGPSLNILIKLISVVALVTAPAMVSFHGTADGSGLQRRAVPAASLQQSNLMNQMKKELGGNENYDGCSIIKGIDAKELSNCSGGRVCTNSKQFLADLKTREGALKDPKDKMSKPEYDKIVAKLKAHDMVCVPGAPAAQKADLAEKKAAEKKEADKKAADEAKAAEKKAAEAKATCEAKGGTFADGACTEPVKNDAGDAPKGDDAKKVDAPKGDDTKKADAPKADATKKADAPKGDAKAAK